MRLYGGFSAETERLFPMHMQDIRLVQPMILPKSLNFRDFSTLKQKHESDPHPKEGVSMKPTALHK